LIDKLYIHVYTCQLIDKRRTLSLSHKSVGIPRVDVINRVCNDQIFANKPAPFLPIFSTGGPCWGTYGFVALNHWWQIRRFHGRWPGASLGLFVDTVSPTCQIAALLYALVSDAEGPYLNRPSQRKSLPVPDISTNKLVTCQPAIPNGS